MWSTCSLPVGPSAGAAISAFTALLMRITTHRLTSTWERGWVCRSCHAGGGVQDLARRLGLEASSPTRPRPARRVLLPPPGVSRDAWRAAWGVLVDTARRQDRRLAPYRDVFRIADWLRRRNQLVVDARHVVSALGPDDPAAWRLARLAARVNTEAGTCVYEPRLILIDEATPGALRVPSEQLVKTLCHEIAHSQHPGDSDGAAFRETERQLLAVVMPDVDDTPVAVAARPLSPPVLHPGMRPWRGGWYASRPDP